MEDNQNAMETTTTSAEPQIKQFEFHGKAGEFFTIWIVNVALTILTLGIYSAWAKVRTQQYFYGNTFLDGVSFRYTADPVKILKGRVIAVVLFMLYYFSTTLSPKTGFIIFLGLMLLVPALLVMSLSFRLRYSMYRNVSFSFITNYRQAYKVFGIPVALIGLYVFLIVQQQHILTQDNVQEVEVVWLYVYGVLIVVSLIAVLFPWWEFAITHFKVEHARYGSSRFHFLGRMRQYYKMYGVMYMGAFLIFVIFFSVIFAAMQGITQEEGKQAPVFMPFISLLIMPGYLWIFAYLQAKRTNLLYGNLELEGNRVHSNMKAGYLLYLYITNTLGMALTLGLLMPWAKVRTAKYRASVTSIALQGDLGEFVATQEQQRSAVGEEIGEMFDLDLGF